MAVRDYLRFGDEVDAVTCGDFPRTNALKICATPPLYIEAGFRQVPMLYTQRHLLDANRPKSDYDSHCHGLTVAQAKRLPELLSDPVMLCDSPTRDDVLLALLCEADGDGPAAHRGDKAKRARGLQPARDGYELHSRGLRQDGFPPLLRETNHAGKGRVL